MKYKRYLDDQCHMYLDNVSLWGCLLFNPKNPNIKISRFGFIGFIGFLLDIFEEINIFFSKVVLHAVMLL